MADEWYCRISDEESGPISAPELKVMAAKGLLSPQDMVRRGEKGTWVAAARVKGLFSQGEAPAAGTTAGPSPQSTPTQTAPAKPKRILRAKAVADDADASVSAPPAGFPEHSGANDHPSGGPPPLRRKGTRPRPRRRRRPQKRRRPFQPAMPTSISWEEIRMRPRLVPRSRRSRRPASRRRGSSSSPAWFGCLSAWRRHWRS